MSNIGAIFQNKILLAGIVAWFAAQGYKIIHTLVKEKKFDFERIMGSGGMPSSHTASIVAVTFAIGKNLGYDSPLFALCFMVSFIVMYDAANVRMAAGKQAQVLNALIKELSNDIKMLPKVLPQNEELRELLGHTYLEVFVGFVLGVIVGISL